MIMSKPRLLKILILATLGLAVFHLWVSLNRVPAGRSDESRVPKNAAVVSGFPDHAILGTDEESLIEFAPIDSLIDSLLIHTYGLRALWVKNDRVETERALYERKVVQIPSNFTVTLFNLDLKALLEPLGWTLLAVRERMSKYPGALDVFIDVGRDRTVYAQLHLLVNRNLAPRGREVAILISGFGLSYDDLTKAFLELPENITLIVPKGQQHSKIIAHEARRSGKSVVTRMPRSDNVQFLDDRPDEGVMREQLYQILAQSHDSAIIIAYEKIHTLNVLRTELPLLPKKGYRLVSYGER